MFNFQQFLTLCSYTLLDYYYYYVIIRYIHTILYICYFIVIIITKFITINIFCIAFKIVSELFLLIILVFNFFYSTFSIYPLHSHIILVVYLSVIIRFNKLIVIEGDFFSMGETLSSFTVDMTILNRGIVLLLLLFFLLLLRLFPNYLSSATHIIKLHLKRFSTSSTHIPTILIHHF